MLGAKINNLLDRMDKFLCSEIDSGNSAERQISCIPYLFDRIMPFRMHEVQIRFVGCKYEILSFHNNGSLFRLDPPAKGSFTFQEESIKCVSVPNANAFSRDSVYAACEDVGDLYSQLNNAERFVDGAIYDRKENNDEMILTVERNKPAPDSQGFLKYRILFAYPVDRSADQTWLHYIYSKIPAGTVLKY